MVARSKKNLPVIIKFKRQAQTVFVTATPRETYGVLISRLVDTINGSGGLRLDNHPHKLQDKDSDIDIPQPSFDVASDDDDDDDDDTAKPGTIQVAADKLKFALPKDASDIYRSGYIDLECTDSDRMDELGLEDNSVVAFALKDEEYEICEPERQEE